MLGLLVLVRRHVAAAALDHELHVDGTVTVERGDVQVGVVHLDTGRRLDVGGSDLTGTGLAQVHDHRLVLLRGEHEALQIEDDLGDVLDDTREGGELVQVAVDLDAGQGSTGDRGQQRTTQRVAEGVTEAGLEGLDDEPRTVLVEDLFAQGRALGDQHGCVPFRVHHYLKTRSEWSDGEMPYGPGCGRDARSGAPPG
ncbi:hypothetical protein SDC9_71140 [bioreactor metagenome]|uniref:Uncharacterized protein n=1 Tax=bioreactor metagenome TaxID=1076179 RepID=A0A644Y917_9ZZZZ